MVEADLITVIWPLGLDNSRDIDLATVIVFANFFFLGKANRIGLFAGCYYFALVQVV